MNDANACCISIGWLLSIKHQCCYTLCILHKKQCAVNNVLIESFVITAMMLRTHVQLCDLTYLVLGHVIIILNVLLSSISHYLYIKLHLRIAANCQESYLIELGITYISQVDTDVFFITDHIFMCSGFWFWHHPFNINEHTHLKKKIPVMLSVLC